MIENKNRKLVVRNKCAITSSWKLQSSPSSEERSMSKLQSRKRSITGKKHKWNPSSFLTVLQKEIEGMQEQEASFVALRNNWRQNMGEDWEWPPTTMPIFSPCGNYWTSLTLYE